MRPDAICTIGYDGGTIDAFIRTLRRAGIALVLDIRAAGLAQEGFFEEPARGPLVGGGHRLSSFARPRRPESRARRRGRRRHLEVDRIFLAHMDEPEAPLDLGEAIALAKEQPVCLLCLERDPEHCHRMIVANRMVGETGQELRHLFVGADAARPG